MSTTERGVVLEQRLRSARTGWFQRLQEEQERVRQEGCIRGRYWRGEEGSEGPGGFTVVGTGI